MSYLPFKLQNLYSELDRLKSSGEDVVADIRAEINNLELEYLKVNVIPEVAKALAEKISGLRCEIDFSLQFNGESKIDYSLFTSSSSVLIRETLDTNELNTTSIAKESEQSYTSSERSLDETKNEIQGNHNTSPASSTVSIKDYSDKAIVVYGDTKPYSDFFKSHGGYFNPRLREGAGWVFSKKREDEIREFLGLKSSDEPSQDSLESTVETFDTTQTITIAPNNDPESIYQYFSNLIKNIRTRTDNNVGYRSPHKAIMLLAIFEAIYYGTLRENKIYFNPNLISRYERLWKEYVPSHIKFTSNPSAPYIHLGSEPFYSLCVIRSNFDKNQNWTPQQVRSCVRYSQLDERLFSIINKKFHSFKKLLIDTFLDFSKQESESSKLSSNNIQISNFSDKGFNLTDYKKYLLLVESAHGRKYSPSSINVYGSALKSPYMIGKVKKYLPSGNLFEIVNYNDLNQLYADVLRDTDSKLAASSYAVALKLYIQFFREVKKESFALTSPTETLITNTSNRNNSDVARVVPHNGKLKRIITPNFSLSGNTPTAMLIDFVERIGAQTVYNLKIPYLGRYLVDITRNPKYMGQTKYINGYWLNTCSSTAKKIELMQLIADRLGIDIKFITE